MRADSCSPTQAQRMFYKLRMGIGAHHSAHGPYWPLVGDMATRRGTLDWAAKEAKKLGYVARSALKLSEIQDKHRVIPRDGRVLDLGAGGASSTPT